MTVRQLGEIVQLLLGYQTDDKPTDDREVFFVADQIRGQLIAQYVKENGSTVIPQFCLPMLLPLQYDTVRARWYVDLATQIIGLENNQGVIQVGLPQEEETSFIMTQAGMTSVTSSMEVGLSLGRPKCWIEGTRIYMFYVEPAWNNLLVKCIPSLFAKNADGEDLLGENDQIPQPYDFNNYLIENSKQAFMIVKATIPDKVNETFVTPQ